MNSPCLHTHFWFGDNPAIDSVVYCRLAFHRSLEGELFTPRCTTEDLQAIQDRLLSTLASLIGDSGLIISPANEHECLPSFREVFDLPSITSIQNGQTLFVGPKGRLFLINVNSHLCLSQIGSGTHALETFHELIDIDTKLDRLLTWACSQSYGFLNPDPIHTGSGLECNALLFLPGIMESDMFDRVMKGLLSQGFSLSVYNAEEGDEEDPSMRNTPYPLVQLHYDVSPEMSEQEGLERIQLALDGLIKGERATRERLIQSLKDEIQDGAFRAFGILSHVHLIEKDECRKLLLDLRKGFVYNCLPLNNSEGFIREIDQLWFTIETLVRQELESVPKQQLTDNLIKSLRAKLVRSVLSQYHIDRGI